MNEGAASAGAHVISTICDSTHEALVCTNTLVLLGGEDGEIEEHVSVCVPVLPWSLLLSIECEGRARGRLR